MKTTNSYKGFETWWNGIRMSMKMYLYVFFILLGFQIIITIGVSYVLYGHRYAAIGNYIIDVLRNKQSPDMEIVYGYFKYLALNTALIFVASAVIYFAYPFAIGMFKARSKNQSRTKHLSGAGLISANEFARQIGKGDLPFGSFRLPWKEETKHCLAIGRPGTGKTVFLS